VNLGVSFDGLRARGVALDDDGNVVARAAAKEVSSGAAGVISELRAAGKNARIDALVLASDPDPDSKSWGFGLEVDGRSVPVSWMSLGNALAFGEMVAGAGRSARNIVAFSLGRSVASGVVVDGRLLTGAHDRAGAIGWLSLNPVERDDYRRLGCLEAEGSSAGIVKRFAWRVKSGDESDVVARAGGNLANVQVEHILEGAGAGDGVAISIVRDTVRYVAMAICNIAAVVDPEIVVLGGILETSADLMLEPIRQECARRLPPFLQDRVKIEITTLGEDAAAIGAAHFAAKETAP